jgi:hypothetical protein
MTVTLTSPVFGLNVDDPYTGPEEAWLLAEGYAKQAGYTGPGVSNTGPTDVDPGDDPTLAANREPAPDAIDAEHVGGGLPDPGPRDSAMGYTDAKYPAYDFDADGVDTEAPADFTLEPNEGLAAGGTEVTISGQNLTGTTGVTFGGVAATSVEVVDDSTVTCVTGAHAAGAVDVVVTDNVGSKTETGAFTYA